MGRAVKLVVWLAVFGGAASIGALVASHSNPFPPGVADPGAAHNVSVSATPNTPHATGPRYRGTLESSTYHQLYVGGRCTSHWRASFAFTVGEGKVTGTGTAKRVGGLVCSFRIAQPEIRTIDVKVVGTVGAGTAHLRLVEVQHAPLGSSDFGGFTGTVLSGGPLSVLDVPIATGANGSHASAPTKLTLHRLDEEGRGTYVSVNRVRIVCTACAAASSSTS